MILDDKIISLCNSIIKQFKTSCFIFVYLDNFCLIKAININHTVLLNIKLKKEDLTVYPEQGVYLLPVKKYAPYYEEGDIELDFNEYHKYDNSRDKYACSNVTGPIVKDMYNQNLYTWYPCEDFKKIFNVINDLDEYSCIGFSYLKNMSSISCNLLNEALFGEMSELHFKLIDTDRPLFIRYKSKFEDLLIIVYAAVAAKVETKGNFILRVK